MAELETFRAALLRSIEREADRRDRLAEQPPIDARDRHTAAALWLLRDRVAALPADSLEIFRLAGLWNATNDVETREALTARETAVLRKFGFDLAGDARSFLRQLASEFKQVLGGRR